MKIIFFLMLIVGCSHQKTEAPHLANTILFKMKTEEKYRLLRSYRFLQNLAENSSEKIPIADAFLPGIPRLGIPSIEFVSSPGVKRLVAQEEKTLKVGFVNLIRDSEKTQVFGSFDEASAVDSIMGPQSAQVMKEIVKRELKDLDLFFVQEKSFLNSRHYICAHYRKKDDFQCVFPQLKKLLRQMGMTKSYDQILSTERLSRADLDQLVLAVLHSMEVLSLLGD